jgi:hypothetical protein
MQPVSMLKQFIDYDEIILTGGEPFLHPQRLLRIINYYKENGTNPNQKIFVYTAMIDFNEYVLFNEIIALVDGIHYTIHEGCNLEDFYLFQSLIDKYPEKSFRLYMLPSIDFLVAIRPSAWSRVEVKPWITEDVLCLPEGEELYYLT